MSKINSKRAVKFGMELHFLAYKYFTCLPFCDALKSLNMTRWCYVYIRSFIKVLKENKYTSFVVFHSSTQIKTENFYIYLIMAKKHAKVNAKRERNLLFLL